MGRIVLFLILCFTLFMNNLAADPRIIFSKGYSALSHGDLDSALSYFRQLEDLHITSPQLFYNMGIIFFDKKQFSLSRLYFERAKFLDPGFEDNNFNLKQVVSILESNFPVELKINTGVKGWHEWLSKVSLKSVIWVLTLLYVLLLLSVIPLFIARNWKWFTIFTVVFIIWFALLVVAWEKINFTFTPMGIILHKCEMRMTPDKQSKVMLELPSGVKIQIVERVPFWIKVTLENGITGWIAEKKVGLINPPYFFHVPTAVRKILSIH